MFHAVRRQRGFPSLGNLIALTEGIFFAGMSLASQKATRTNALGITALGNLVTALVVFALFPSARAPCRLWTAGNGS